MSDIIKQYKVRTRDTDDGSVLNLYFDNGSPFTFVKRKIARRLGGPIGRLPNNVAFYGLGDGVFYATHSIHIEVELLDIWCKHLCYVISDETLAEDEDILIGHDFMQRYDIKLAPKQKEIILNRNALLRAQKIRKC